MVHRPVLCLLIVVRTRDAKKTTGASIMGNRKSVGYRKATMKSNRPGSLFPTTSPGRWIDSHTLAAENCFGGNYFLGPPVGAGISLGSGCR